MLFQKERRENNCKDRKGPKPVARYEPGKVVFRYELLSVETVRTAVRDFREGRKLLRDPIKLLDMHLSDILPDKDPTNSNRIYLSTRLVLKAINRVDTSILGHRDLLAQIAEHTHVREVRDAVARRLAENASLFVEQPTKPN